MRLLSVLFFVILLSQLGVFAELSSSSCALLRTASSLTRIVPEIAQLAMRYYRASSHHHRQKRFLFGENTAKNGSSNIKGSLVEQMIANAVRDVNFTNVALLILENNETMSKLRQNVDDNAIIRTIIRQIDYEKLGAGLWNTAEKEFNLEHFIASIINKTHIGTIYEQILTNGTVPEWILISIYPDLNSQTIQQMFLAMKNVTYKFVRVLSKSERFDNYLFNMVTQQGLTPLSNIIQGIKEKKPETLDQLIEIIVNNVNKVVMEQITTSGKRTTTKKSGNKAPIVTVDLNNDDDVKLMLYQWSIAMDSMGQTVRIMLKSLEYLYCTSVLE